MGRLRQIIGAAVLIGALTACAGQSTGAAGGSSAASSGAASSGAPPSSPVSSSPASSSAPSSAPAGSGPVSSAPTSSSPESSAPVSPSTPPSSSPDAPTSPTRPSVPVTPPTGKQLTLTGTVQAGVEPSCLVLTDTATKLRYNLTGGDPAVVKVGATVTVVGMVRKDLMSYCQQGQIFQVVKASTK